MHDLSRLGPFRVKDNKEIFKAKISFFKICLQGRHFRFFFEYIIFFNYFYVIAYESTNQAKEANFCYKMKERTPRILTRHRRIWKMWNEPVLVTLIG